MSLIENALKKLQGAAAAAPQAPARRAREVPALPIPEARKQKASIGGTKHHVDQGALVRAGLLAPPDLALPIADEFRRIKRPLIANAFASGPGAESHANIIMITSPLPGAGKTFCSVNLAASLSLERDLNVLLVDADVAKPHITREFGLEKAPGLIDLLHTGGDVADVLVRTDLNDIMILPAGRLHAQATELLASERMRQLVHDIATRYSDRIIILDSPPLLITSEAQVLASQAGQITLIVEAGRTTQQQLTQAVEVLDKSKSVNIVVNKTRGWGWAGGGDYSEYGYGSYQYGSNAD